MERLGLVYRLLLVGLGVATVLAGLVIIFWRPDQPAGLAVPSLLALIGAVVAMTVMGVSLRLRQWWRPAWYVSNLQLSARQGLEAGAAVAGLLLLQANGLLFWWVGLLVGLTIIFLEMALIAR